MRSAWYGGVSENIISQHTSLTLLLLLLLLLSAVAAATIAIEGMKTEGLFGVE